MAEVLSDAEVRTALAELPGWALVAGEITKTFNLPSFPEAIALVNGAAEAAEEHGHHPDIDIRYTRVRFGLTTHDAGGVTALDLAMAHAIEEQAAFAPDERVRLMD